MTASMHRQALQLANSGRALDEEVDDGVVEELGGVQAHQVHRRHFHRLHRVLPREQHLAPLQAQPIPTCSDVET